MHIWCEDLGVQLLCRKSVNLDEKGADIWLNIDVRVEHKIILASILLGILIWVVDAIAGAYFFRQGTILTLLVQEMPSNEVYLRSVSVAVVLTFGFIISRIAGRAQRSQELFRELFTNISGGVAIFEVAKHGGDFILKDINPAVERIEGVAKADVIGKSANDILKNAMELKLLEIFERVWRTGEAEKTPPMFWLRGARIKSIYRLPTGEVAAVYDDEDERRWMEEEIGRRTEEVGRLVQELNCLYGISRLAEEPGITSEGIIRGTVDLIPVAWKYPSSTYARIVVGDRECATENYRETPWRLRANIMMEDVPAGSIEVGYLDEKPSQYEGPFLAREKALIQMIAEQLGHTLSLKRAQEAIHEHAKTLEAVNRDLKNTRSELLQMGKLSVMGKMAAEMAHEINNPLGAIRVHIDGLIRDIERDRFDAGEAQSALGAIRKSVENIAKAVGRMRYFVKQSDESCEALDLNGTVSGSLDILRSQLERDSIKISETYAPTPMKFYGNTNMLEHLFTNLILNARDAIKAKGDGGGSIRIETHEGPAQGVVATIEDDGQGMDEDVVAQLFSPFFTTKDDGVGLGMAIVRRILDVHKGKIEVASSPEHGTKFTISFPRDRREVERE